MLNETATRPIAVLRQWPNRPRPQPAADYTCACCHVRDRCRLGTMSTVLAAKIESLVLHPNVIEAGTRLFTQQEKMQALYVVKAGALKSVFLSEDGSEQITGFWLPGDFLGLDALQFQRHQTTAIALERTAVCKIPYRGLEELAAAEPGLHKELFGALCEVMARTQRHRWLLGKRSSVRLATFLSELAERSSSSYRAVSSVMLSMSRHDIANYLGMAPETISRILSRWARQEIVAIAGRGISIRAPERLADVACGLCFPDAPEPTVQ